MSLALLAPPAPPVPVPPLVGPIAGPTFTKTLAHVREQVEKDDHAKWDTLVPCRDLVMDQGRLTFPQAQTDGFEQGLNPTPWATSQLCQRLNIPAGYFRKCPPSLRDVQFNYWNHSEEVGRQFTKADTDPDERWLLRAKGSTLRGVLSSRYARLDNAALLDTLLPVLSGASGNRYQVGLAQLTSESFHLRLVDPSIARDVLPGDRLMVGVHVANSEVGLRAVTVDALVFRLVCANGLIRRVNSRSLLRQRHLHVSEPKFAHLLAQALQEAVIVAAGFIEQIAQTTTLPVPHPEAALSVLAESWELPKHVQDLAVFTLAGESRAETLYGLVNALTSAAQTLPVDERFHLETRAGSLVDGSADKVLLRRVLSAMPTTSSATSSATAAAAREFGR